MAMLEVIRNAGEIRNLQQLLDHVGRARNESPTGAVWLRGISDERHQLIPSAGRQHQFAGRKVGFDKALERRMLHRFRRHAFEFFGRVLTEWEALFVARHHGLPVRLLDWTANPMAALFFACEFMSEERLPNSKIWFLIPKPDLASFLDVFADGRNPLDVKGIKLVYPMGVAARINAQSGLFTIQADIQKPLDEINVSSYNDKEVDIRRLAEFSVPAQCRASILKELNDLQITRRTLFPDLDGLSAGMMSAEILRGPTNRDKGQVT
jgi:FRG domain